MSGRKPARVDQRDLSMGSLASFSFFPTYCCGNSFRHSHPKHQVNMQFNSKMTLLLPK